MKILKWGSLVLLLGLGIMANPLYSAQPVPVVQTISGQFNGSGDVAVDSNGFIYVADFGDNINQVANGDTVYKISPVDGSIEVFATGFEGASGNAFDSKGNLFQSSIAGNFISKITADGEVTTFADNTDGVISPVGIAIDTDDNVFVNNCTRNNILRISADGSESEIFAQIIPGSQCPNGLTIDDHGNLYTANFNNGRVLKIDPEGQVSIFVSLPGSNNGHITFANGVLYATARRASQIYEISLEGEVRLLAGTGAHGNVDGPALEAHLSFPNGIAASPDGNTIYFNDAVPTDGNAINPVLLRALVLEPTSE
jgi:sugar lactone lactonase YvrE